ncbi:ADP-ribosylglycohydrolase [Pluteus cervinus]|uniref:ADP-ribosylglycohydrolase n=1 Tax=Pluteus cervinus TaxID=181527 RepID=A0ACD3B0N0_9AGAR|nr:ADP-ribosylglycohydrolase [Pluteus cervinus]
MVSTHLLDFLTLHPFVGVTLQDKIRGVILGSAIGDAVGLYTEFLPKTQAELHPPVSFWPPPITTFRGDSHRDRFKEGSWTDDTDLSLLILLSYLHNNALVPTDFAQRLYSWRSQGLRCLDRLPLGIGQNVSKVLLQEDFVTNPINASKVIWENSSRYIAPNGSLMRTHVLGIICLGMTKDQTFQTAMDFSLTTHYDPRCVVGCVAATGLIRGILRGEITSLKDVDDLLEEAFTWTQSNHPEANDQTLSHEEYLKHTSAESTSNLDDLQLDDARKMGYVYKGLSCGLWALRRAISGTSTFHDLIWGITLQGGDADTNACIAGALAGSWIGWGHLPPCWRDGLNDHEWLSDKTDKLMIAIGVKEGRDVGAQDLDTELYGGRGMLSEDECKKREQALMEKILLKMDARRKEKEKEERGGGVWGALKRLT